MTDNSLRRARILSVAASTAIALACGTNYAYSAWGPEYAETLGLSATESNVIGAGGNLGMYAMGIPAGLIVDKRSPRLAIIVGTILLGWGYFFLQKNYQAGEGSTSVSWSTFYTFLTGAGSCAAFSAAVKTSAFNWPERRGTATAFPLSGFGLSAFFFTTIANVVFPDNTHGYLLCLTFGTAGLCAISIPFIRLISVEQSYVPIAAAAARQSIDRSTADDPADAVYTPSLLNAQQHAHARTHSLSPARDSMRGDEEVKVTIHLAQEEFTGLQLLRKLEFYQLFCMLGLLGGVGLMTINNIGNDAKALWTAYDPSATHSFIQSREQMHVSLLSLCSFAGRFLSGVGSDYLVQQLGKSRFWCLAVSACVFALAQFLGLSISNPNLLFFVSGFTGLAYGALFGVFPALTADEFGVHGLSLNWGFMLFAPVFSGNLFNLIYGHVFDAHSTLAPSPSPGTPGTLPHRECGAGLECYRSAYYITLLSSFLGLAVVLSSIRYQALKHGRLTKNATAEA